MEIYQEWTHIADLDQCAASELTRFGHECCWTVGETLRCFVQIGGVREKISLDVRDEFKSIVASGFRGVVDWHGSTNTVATIHGNFEVGLLGRKIGGAIDRVVFGVAKCHGACRDCIDENMEEWFDQEGNIALM